MFQRPVQTQFGWHVINLNETRLKDAPPLEEVRGELADEIRRAAIEARVEELTGGAEVTRMTVEDIDPALLERSLFAGELSVAKAFSVSPLAPKGGFPELPSYRGVRFATVAAGVKYSGRDGCDAG